ncbi:hypothetical protein D3C72_1850670 [compost metagenome]
MSAADRKSTSAGVCPRSIASLPSAFCSRLRIIVVLPAPRKPVMTVAGILPWLALAVVMDQPFIFSGNPAATK